MSMVIVEDGHVVLAKVIFDSEFHLAWGDVPEGYDTSSWEAGDVPPAEASNTTGLLQEVGRRVSTLKSFVIEDPQGTISANDSSWSVSKTPTRHVYLQFKFDAQDASNKVIRQVGIFSGTVKKDTVPIGQMFLTPSDLEDDGILFMIQNIEPNSRNASTREIYEYVITL